MDGNVSLTISKEIVTPIVEAKVKEAILAALGGSDAVIRQVVDQIINQKVDTNGKISSYSSENKFSWIDVAVKDQIKRVAEEEIRTVIAESSSAIKDEIIKSLQSKKGASQVANVMLAALSKTLSSSYSSKIDVFIEPR